MKLVLAGALLVLSGVVFTSAPEVNTLTGQAEKAIKLFDARTSSGFEFPVSLRYSSAGINKMNGEPNSPGSTSWVGYGWRLGIPSIFVVHNGTVDRADDRWFLTDQTGTMSEIVRVWAAGQEAFKVRGLPFVKVNAQYAQDEVGANAWIRGWEVIEANGTTYRYGGSADPTCSRYVMCRYNRVLGREEDGGTGQSMFWYQWDLREMEDVEGAKISLTYNQYSDETNTHTIESYVKEIRTDCGDVISFELDSDRLTANESRPTVLPLGPDHDFFPTRYLSKIYYRNSEGVLLNEYGFGYSKSTEFVNAFKQGFAKRLLTKLTASSLPASTYTFQYYSEGDYYGYLRSVETNSGSSETSEYSTLTMGSDLKLSISALSKDASHLPNVTILDTTNHVFVLDATPSGTTPGTGLEILDLRGNRWDQWTRAAALPGAPYAASTAGFERFMPNTKGYPYGDRLVLVSEDKSGSTITAQHLRIYEYYSGSWVNTFTRDFTSTTKSLLSNSVQIQQTESYVLVWEPTQMIVYVFEKIAGVWSSTFNSPSGGTAFPNGIADEYGHDASGAGWNWPNTGFVTGGHLQKAQIFTAHNFFLFTFRKTFTGETQPRVCVQSFVRYGEGRWMSSLTGGITPPSGTASMVYGTVNQYTYQLSDVLMQVNTLAAEAFQERISVGDRFFVVSRNRDASAVCDLGIRRFSPSSAGFLPNTLSGPTLPSAGNQSILQWPRRLKVFSSERHLVLLEHENDSWMQVYKLYPATSEFLGTFIAPVVHPFGTATDPTSSNSSTHGGGGSYAKAFNRNDLVDLKIDDRSIVALFGSGQDVNSVLYSFRWNDATNKWESLLSGYDHDLQGQLIGTGFRDTKLILSRSVWGVWASALEDYATNPAYHAFVWSPDYAKSRYTSNDVSVNSMTAGLSSRGMTSFTGTGNAMEIRTFFQEKWEGNPTAVVVAKSTVDGGQGGAVQRTYVYAYANTFFDISSGVPFFSEIGEYLGDGSKSGTVVSKYSLDADNYRFGLPLGTENRRASDAAVTASTENIWEIKDYALGSSDFSHVPFLGEQRTTRDQVPTKRQFCMNADNENGLTDWTYESNSDKTGLAVKKIYAFKKYPGMKTRNMLVQACGEEAYSVPSGTTWACAQVGTIVNASATVWEPQTVGASTRWRGRNKFVWKSPMNSAGLPTTTYTAFDYTAPPAATPSTSASGWIWTSGVEAYDSRGRAIQATNAGGQTSVDIYGMRVPALVGSIANASVGECGILTGDYDLNELFAYAQGNSVSSFDADDGWEKGGATISSDADGILFGAKSVKAVNCFGPSRNFKVNPSTDYIFSAWVKVKAGPSPQKLVMGGDYRHLASGASDVMPYNLGAAVKAFGCSNKEVAAPANVSGEKWQYIEMRIPASTDVSGSDWYTRVYVGTPGAGTAYICDVRYYPADAVPTSTYYDQKWRRPVVAVDANGKPGTVITYDSFGRTATKTKLSLATGQPVRTPLQSATYGSTYPPELTIPSNNGPSAPGGLNAQLTGTTATFSWNAAVDPDGDPVKYSLYIDGLNWVASGLTSTTYTKSVDLGALTWHVAADDGKETSISLPKTLQVGAAPFALFNIAGDVVGGIPITLFSAIKASLSTAKQASLESTYPDNDGTFRLLRCTDCGARVERPVPFNYGVYHTFEKRYDAPSPQCPTGAGYHSVEYHKGWTYFFAGWNPPSSQPLCYPGFPCEKVSCTFESSTDWPEGSEAGVGNVDNSVDEMSRIRFRATNASVAYPDMSFEAKIRKTLVGSYYWVKRGWNGVLQSYTDQNNIVGLKIVANTPGYHAWYRVCKRDGSWSSWTGSPNSIQMDTQFIDKIQVLIYYYN